MKDEHYIIDLCDEILGLKAERQKRFGFLRADAGTCLPVDAFYKSISLVIEYRERQHTEAVPFWDRKPTASGIPRGKQRLKYDTLRREVLPQHGITLVELSFADFRHGKNKRLERDLTADRRVLADRLARYRWTADQGR